MKIWYGLLIAIGCQGVGGGVIVCIERLLGGVELALEGGGVVVCS